MADFRTIEPTTDGEQAANEMALADHSRTIPEPVFYGSIAGYIKAITPEAANFKPKQVVYFIGQESGPVKIGTTVDPSNRLKHIQCGSPVPLKILAAVPGGIGLERGYHRAFGLHRLHGEWFDRHSIVDGEIRYWRAKVRRLPCVSD